MSGNPVFECPNCGADLAIQSHIEGCENAVLRKMSDWAKAKAFNIITRHPDCLLDDTNLDDFIEDIARELDNAREFGADEFAHRGAPP